MAAPPRKCLGGSYSTWPPVSTPEQPFERGREFPLRRLAQARFMSQTSRHCSPPNSSPCPSKQRLCTTEASLGNGPSEWRLCCNRLGFDGCAAQAHTPCNGFP